MNAQTIVADALRPQHRNTGKHGYRPDIDGLRSVSILLVVAYHAGLSTFAGGFVGVDVLWSATGWQTGYHH